MKTTRIGQMILIANRKAATIIDAMPEGRAKTNTEGINAICKALVARPTPLMPTAPIVAEEGRKHNPHFPVEQTIYNGYSQILRIWKRAYHDIMNIDAQSILGDADVADIDTTTLDVSTANIVDRLKEIIREVTQRNNILKKIIDDIVPVPASDIQITPDVEAVVTRLARWLRELSSNPAFQLDEIGLKVCRRTPLNTRIIDAELLEELISFTDEFANIQKARNATGT